MSNEPKRATPKTLEIFSFPPGSLIWVKTDDPVGFIKSIKPEQRETLSKLYQFVITSHRVDLSEISPEYLDACGLQKAPG